MLTLALAVPLGISFRASPASWCIPPVYCFFRAALFLILCADGMKVGLEDVRARQLPCPADSRLAAPTSH